MFEIRKAKLTDVEALSIARVEFQSEAHGAKSDEERALLYKHSLEYFADVLGGNDIVVWIATKDGELAATSGVTFYRHPPNRGCPTGWVACVSNMFTYPQYRGQGLATKLFAMAVDEARTRGCGRVWLNATDMGRPLYAKYGFTDVSGDMAYFIMENR